jgi:hypothetical protein
MQGVVFAFIFLLASEGKDDLFVAVMLGDEPLFFGDLFVG